MSSKPELSPIFTISGRALTALPRSLQYLGETGTEYVVFKNDEKTVEEIRAMNPAGILVSPGPGKLSCMATKAPLAIGDTSRNPPV
jgi:anthranilate/para-aminobenzoate synthase component II